MCVKIVEVEVLCGVGYFQNCGVQYLIVIWVDQVKCDGNDVGGFFWLFGCGCCGLGKVQNQCVIGKGFGYGQVWCVGIGILEFELCQVVFGCVLEYGDLVFDCVGLIVVVVEIQIQCGVIGVVVYQLFQYFNDFGVFFIDGCGIEIVDFLIVIGVWWMGQWVCVFVELVGVQGLDIGDVFDCG